MWHLEAILPFGFGGVDASIFEVVEVGSIETRLAVSYEDEIVVITFHLKFIFFDVAKRRFDLDCSAWPFPLVLQNIIEKPQINKLTFLVGWCNCRE